MIFLCFFFSSRRRHTRSLCDWSSDVCSSDLVNIQAGEATAANDDGRLPKWDKGARVVVFANGPAVAKQVASEIAKKAYWNSSYFGGSLLDLRRAEAFDIESEGPCPGPN